MINQDDDEPLLYGTLEYKATNRFNGDQRHIVDLNLRINT